MSYRPYPNPERALKQLDRHYPPMPVIQTPECLQPMADSFARLRVNARNAVEVGLEVGTYRMSTRPRVVSGDA